jgi:hypothetical protein
MKLILKVTPQTYFDESPRIQKKCVGEGGGARASVRRSDVEETLHKYTSTLLNMYIYRITSRILKICIYLTVAQCSLVSLLLQCC